MPYLEFEQRVVLVAGLVHGVVAYDLPALDGLSACYERLRQVAVNGQEPVV